MVQARVCQAGDWSKSKVRNGPSCISNNTACVSVPVVERSSATHRANMPDQALHHQGDRLACVRATDLYDLSEVLGHDCTDDDRQITDLAVGLEVHSLAPSPAGRERRQGEAGARQHNCLAVYLFRAQASGPDKSGAFCKPLTRVCPINLPELKSWGYPRLRPKGTTVGSRCPSTAHGPIPVVTGSMTAM